MINRYGETLTLERRRKGEQPTRWVIRAKVTGYAPEELVNDITSGDRKVIVSALEATRKGVADELVTLNTILRNGQPGIIRSVDMIKIGDVPERYVLRVRGFPN
jgi:hypothetical protein